MENKLLSIQEAANILDVSTKTLRRWEEKGILIPQRTPGNQRRYTHQQLIDFKNKSTKTKPLQPDLQIEKTNVAELLKKKWVIYGLSGLTAFSFMLFSFLILGVSHLPQNNGFTKSLNLLADRITGKAKSFNNPDIKILSREALVLADNTSSRDFLFQVNVPAEFTKFVELKDTLSVSNFATFSADITAPNIIYSLTPGTGIGITESQTPTITNTGVLSLQGESGDLELAAGDGITLDGLTLVNDDKGSDQNIFKTLKIGSDNITAGSNNDTIELLAGSGITLSSDPGNKKVTITGVSPGWTDDGSIVRLTTLSDSVGIGTTNPSSFKLQVEGNVGPNSDNVFDLGSSSLQWRDAYFGRDVYIGGSLISVGGVAAFWQRASGVLAPAYITDDLVIGGTATSSAKFQIIGTTGNATTSGNLTFNTAGSIQTTDNQNLTLGGNSTGNIFLNPFNGTGYVGIGTSTPLATLDVAGNASASGNLTLYGGSRTVSTTSMNNLTIGGSTTGLITIDSGTGNITLSDDTTFSGNIIKGSDIISDFTGNGLSVSGNALTLSLLTASDSAGLTSSRSGLEFSDTDGDKLSLIQGCSNGQILKWDEPNGIWSCATDSGGGSTGIITVNGDSQTLTDTEALEFNSQDFDLTDSSTTAIISLDSTLARFRVANGAVSAAYSTTDLLIGNSATSSAKFGFLNVNSGTPTASISANSGNNATFLTGAGNLATTNMQDLTLGGLTTGNIIIDAGVGNVIISDGLSVTGNITASGNLSAANFSGTSSGTNTGDQTITLTGDVTGSGTGSFATTIAANSVALTTDTTGDYVGTLSGGNGISSTGATSGEGIAHALSLAALTGNWNQTGAFDIVLNNASSELQILESTGGTFFGSIDVGDLDENETYILPSITGASSASFCLSTGNCAGGSGGSKWQLTSNVIAPLTATDRVVLGGSTTTPFQLEVNGKQTGKALVSLNETGDQDILTASASGSTVMNLDRSGNLSIEGQLSDLSGTSLTINDDLSVASDDLTTTQATFNLLNTTATTINAFSAATTLNLADAAITGTIDIGGVTANGASTVNIATNATTADTINIGNSHASTSLVLTGGDDWSISAAGTLTLDSTTFDQDSLEFVGTGLLTSVGTMTLTPSTTLNLNSTGDMTLDSSTDIILDADGADVILKDATTTFATFTNTGTDLFLNIAGGQLLLADTDVFNIGGVSGLAYNAIAHSGGAATQMPTPDDNDLYIQGNLEIDGTIYTNGPSITSTGDITISNADPRITFDDTDATDDYYFEANTGTFYLTDSTDSRTELNFTGTGSIDLGDNTATKTIDIGGVTSSAIDTINIATNNTAADVISIGNSNASTTLSLTGGDDWSISADGYALFDAGSVGTPGVAFAADTDTGMWSSATNTLDFSAGGVRALQLNTAASGVNYLSITPSATGANPTLAAAGTDSNIDLDLIAKGTGSINFTSAATTGTTTSSAFNFAANSLTSGTGAYFSSSSIVDGRLVDINTAAANTLTTGTLLNLGNSSSALTTGSLLNSSYTGTAAFSGALNNFSWIPGSSATATGDLFRLSLGANGNIGNLFNVLDNTTSLFSISESQITSALPHQFTAAGDVSFGYDAVFTNQSSSKIESYGPLVIESGETFENNDLTLRTYGTGSVVVEQDLYVGEFTSSGTSALCWDNSGGSYINDCSGSPVSDYAEIYPTDNGITYAQLVSGSDNMVPVKHVKTDTKGNPTTEMHNISKLILSTNENRTQIIGVTSPNYGDFSSTGHNSVDAEHNPLPVALSGRVILKVVTQNGDIKPGDPITSSSIPGVGAKANTAGKIVGTALSGYASSDTSAQGEIMVFVHTSWFDPDIYLTNTGNISIFSDPSNPDSGYTLQNASGKNVERNGLFANLGAARIQAGKLDAKEIIINGTDIMSLLSVATSSSSGTISNDVYNQLNNLDTELINQELKLNDLQAKITSIDSLLSQTASDAAFLKSIIEGQVMGASTSAELNYTLAELDIESATVSGNLNVLGRTVLNDLGITGNITAGILSIHGLDGEINTLGNPLKLQSYGLENLDIMNGKIIIDTKGNLDITVGHIVGNETFRGEEILSSNSNTIVIDQNWSTKPKIINVTPSYNTTIWVEDISTDGFTIKVGTKSGSNQKIYWMAVW